MQAMTEDQRQELKDAGELWLLDPETSQRFVVVPEELFVSMRQLLDGAIFDPQTLDVLAAQAFDDADFADALPEQPVS